MRAYRAPVFCTTLLAIIAPAVGVENWIPANSHVYGGAKPMSRLRPLDDNARPRSLALEEVSSGPDPFFADLVDKAPYNDAEKEEDDTTADEARPPRTYCVEVYENESRGLGGRWRELRPGRSSAIRRWSYKVCTVPQDIYASDKKVSVHEALTV